MTDKKYTDEETKRALECCATPACADCKECPYADEKWCVNALMNAVLDLINRYEAEIEWHEKENHEKFNKWLLLDKRTKERYAELYEEAKGVVRAEAIKEFAERLKDYFRQQPLWNVSREQYMNLGFSYDDVFFGINKTVKEMTGETQTAETDFPKDYSYGY